jgi:hypothetical protein
MLNKMIQRPGNRWTAGLLLMLLLTPEIAHVSMVHVKEVTLDQLLKDSTHIVVAVPDSPSEATEEVAVEVSGKTYEPYRRHIDRYRVKESLRGGLKQGASMEVVSANDASLEHMHRLFVIEGTTKSYYDRRYEPKALPARGEPLILFLRKQVQGDKRFSWIAGQSVEGIGMRDEVQRLLRQKPFDGLPGTGKE